MEDNTQYEYGIASGPKEQPYVIHGGHRTEFGAQEALEDSPKDWYLVRRPVGAWEALDSAEREPLADYEMYSDKGNAAVARYVNALIAEGVNGGFTRPELPGKIEAMMKAISGEGFGEVYDTEPSWDVAHEVSQRLCRPLGWTKISREEF